MSYSTWHNYGYGICTDKLVIDSVERLEALLAYAPQYRKRIHDWFESCEITEPTLDDYWESDEDYYLGFATILMEVIHEAEGIEFTVCDDFECLDYLIYMPSYPWHLPENERNLTEAKIAEIIGKYVSIVSDTVLDIEYQSVGNGG